MTIRHKCKWEDAMIQFAKKLVHHRKIHRLPGFHFIDSINHWNREDKD